MTVLAQGRIYTALTGVLGLQQKRVLTEPEPPKAIYENNIRNQMESVLGVGLALLKLLPEAEGILKTLPYLCVGVGAGIFGGNLGTAIKNKAVLKNPQAQNK